MGVVESQLHSSRHPCPYMRHHPGEHCGCALRLGKMDSPPGLAERAFRWKCGGLHDARMENLRWRLSAPSNRGRRVEDLPQSLRGLADDHSLGVAVDLRPRGMRTARTTSSHFCGSCLRGARGGSDPCIGRKAKSRVSWGLGEVLVTEVPHIDKLSQAQPQFSSKMKSVARSDPLQDALSEWFGKSSLKRVLVIGDCFAFLFDSSLQVNASTRMMARR